MLADRLRARQDEIASEIVERYRNEIVDYAASPPEFLEGDVMRVTQLGLTSVLDNLSKNATAPTQAQLAQFKDMLARRPHQGVALPSIQHAFRLFGEHVYDELSACASDDPEDLQAVIRGGAVIMGFAHEVIGVVTQTYLDELEDVSGDREIVSRSLLDAVLSGRASSPSSIRDARILGIDLLPQNVVIVARAPVGADSEDQRPRTLRKAAMTLREVVLQHLETGRALVGVREGEVVCLCPAPKPRDAQPAHDAAHAAAPALDQLGMSVGVGGWHAAAEEVPAAYAEAREAAAFAIRTGVRDRAVVYDDVLVDHVLRASDNAHRMIAAALDPLREYDARRDAVLVDSLRAYIDSNFSLTGAARAMHVHNNTILYRLERIRDLTGRDPRTPRDIVFFALSLRLDAEAPT